MKQIFTLLTVLITTMFVNAQTYTLTDDDVVVTNGVIVSCSYDFAIKDIVIPEILERQVVTGIGDDYRNLFVGKAIASVQLPSTLQTIGNLAFYNNSLTTVTIPNSVTTIGYYAFMYNNLTTVTFEAGSNISSIEQNAFAGNSGLTSITLPTHANPRFVEYKDGNSTTYAEGDNITDFSLFYHAYIPYTLTNDDVVVTNGIIVSCSYSFALKSIIIPETLDGQTVTGIGNDYNNLFYHKSITSVQLPSTLQTLGKYAFRSNNLTTVTIPNSVTSIGDNVFLSNNLTTVTIPNSVTTIGNHAFYNNNLTTVTIPNSVTTIGESAFSDNRLITVIIPNSVTTIGNYAFYSNSLTTVTIPNSVTTIGESVFGSNSLTSVIIPNSVTTIGNYAFSGNSLTTVTIPNSVTIIGESAFGSNSLTSVIIPNSVTTIGNYAFSGNSLTTVTIPNSVTTIGESAFGSNSLTSVIIPNSVTSIGELAFGDNRLITVIIPNSVTTIGNYAFYRNSLTTVTFEANSNILSIGQYAFAANSGLTSITLPTNANPGFVEYKDANEATCNPGGNITNFAISYEAVIATYSVTFNNHEGTTLKPETVEHGSAATAPADPTRTGYTFTGWDVTFDNITADLTVTAQYQSNTYTLTDADVVVTNGIIESCSYDFAIKDIIIPNSLDGQPITGIGDDYDNLFAGKAIASVQLPSTLKTIGEGAFATNKLNSITIPNSVTSVRLYAFYNNNLTSVIFEENSNILDIEEKAFYENAALSAITMPTHANTSFTHYYDGNGNSYSSGETITDFTTYYYTNIPYILTDDDVVVTDGVIESCSYNFGSKIIIIPDILDGQTVTSIGDTYTKLFYDKDIASVQLPSTLQTMGNKAFGHNKLTNVTIPNSVTYIGYAAFQYDSLTNVTFEANSNIVGIEEYAFSENPGLSAITMPTHANTSFTNYLDGNGNTYSPGETITNFTTNYYTNIPYTLTDDDVIVTNGIIESCSYNFSSKIIIIPETLDGQTVTGIGDNVFRTKNIASVQLPSTLQTLGNSAFANNNLISITIPNSVTSIGYAAFNTNHITEYNGAASNGIIYARNTDGSEDYTTIVSYGGVANIIDFIPNPVTSIGREAFSENSLTDVTIPNSITSIGLGAFAFNSLTNATFEENSNILSIELYAFYESSGLSAITLPTHVNTNFVNYSDDNGNTYAPGETISDFHTAYYVNIPYTLTDDDVIVTNGVIDSCSYNFASKIIIIPETLDGQTVTGIGDNYPNLFFRNTLISVQLPSTLQTIGIGAFANNNLNTVTIPSSVISIGEFAFRVNSLDSVIIPNSVTYIAEWAFGFNSLTSVIFEANSNILGIGEKAFYENTDLPDIILPTHANTSFTNYLDGNGNTYSPDETITDFETYYYTDIPYTLTDDDVVVTDGVIESCSYNFASKFIIIPETLDGQTVIGIGNSVFHKKNIASVQLPSTLQIIGDEAFNSNSLTDITIPNSVTSIGNWAFYNNSLTGVTIPNSVTSIGDRAFYRNSLISVTISNSITSIGEAAFSYNSLTNVTIPNSVVSIGIAAFSHNSLTDVTILNSVTYIGDRAFSYNSLTDVTIPNSVTYIANHAFSYNSLISVTIPNSVTYIGNFAFYHNSLISLTIPNSVTYIGDRSFHNNSLTSVTIPNSVTYIGEAAFSYNSLTSVAFEANSNIGSIDKDAFSNNSLTSITLPTHANPGFIEYTDGHSNTYNAGDAISDFSVLYEATISAYEITFNDWDSTTLKTDTVEYNSAATAPADPTRDGYTFTGWDTTFVNVTADLTVTAQYELNTSIEDITNTVLSIYPNPAHNFVFVESSGLEMKSIQIFAITGKLIKTVRPDAQNIRLDVSDLTIGVYFVKVETGSINKVLKFVKR